MIESAYKRPVSIRSSDSSVISLPMEMLAGPMTNVLSYFDDKKVDSANYLMKSALQLDVPVAGERILNISISRRLPAARLPKIKMWTCMHCH